MLGGTKESLKTYSDKTPRTNLNIKVSFEKVGVDWRLSPGHISWGWWLMFASLWVIYDSHSKFGQICSPDKVTNPGLSELGSEVLRQDQCMLPDVKLGLISRYFSSLIFCNCSSLVLCNQSTSSTEGRSIQLQVFFLGEMLCAPPGRNATVYQTSKHLL